MREVEEMERVAMLVTFWEVGKRILHFAEVEVKAWKRRRISSGRKKAGMAEGTWEVASR